MGQLVSEVSDRTQDRILTLPLLSKDTQLPFELSSQLLSTRKTVGTSRFNSKKQQQKIAIQPKKVCMHNFIKELNSLRNEQASDFRPLDTEQMILHCLLYQNTLLENLPTQVKKYSETIFFKN